ncbi:UDP-N-acetylglucosamine 4,6-dehydratase (inverting), partial [Acinetobacter baumannii]|nr:UDP-N-acetylglucosamine 4,6-dehydratase (inverting) [Acinetobacter baumannii]
MLFIPSLLFTVLAAVVAPDATQYVVGIRPGVLLHVHMFS